MARYLLLKHYRGGLEPLSCAPMDQWTPEEVSMIAGWKAIDVDSYERAVELAG